jgi:hypothetical protein
MLCKRCASDSRYWSCSRLYSGNNQLLSWFFFAIEVYRIANAIASRTACLPRTLRNTHIAKLELTFTPVQPLMFRSW